MPKNILYIQGIHMITITWGNGMISLILGKTKIT